MVPDSLTNYSNITWDYMLEETGLSYHPYKKLNSTTLGTNATTLGDVVINKPLSTIDGYTPRNKKLFVYPYNYMMCSNNNGSNGVYQYEYFTANPFSFKIMGAVTPGCSIKGYPRLYKGIDDNLDEGITIGKFPICSYNTDMYTNWLTQNSVNIGTSIASGGLAIASGIAMGMTGAGAVAGGLAIAGGINSIVNTLGEKYQHSLIPPQAGGNLNSGDVIFAMGKNELTFHKMSIKKEFAEIIDKYFDTYGYQINMVKVPNKNHRSNYWYTKTIDINIDGSIPQNDMQKIKDCYNSGITFWKNPNNIQNYSVSNTITG